MRILVVESDESSRQLLETELTAKGYAVVSFDNSLSALSYLQTQAVDLVISDNPMPEMDGYCLCRAIKQDQNLKHIPIVFYTATYTSEQHKHFALSLGAAKYLVKPMLMPELMDMVDEVLRLNQPVDSFKSHDLNHEDHRKLDKQGADLVLSSSDKKILELSEEREKLIASEARFRDFAEASADWFWESDEYLKIIAVTGGPQGLSFNSLTDLAEACHSHSSNEMLKTLQTHKSFADYVVHCTDEMGKLVYLRISGKPVFAKDGNFIGYRGVGRDVSEAIALNRKVEFLASHDELTGLPNRSMFRQRLEHAVTKAAREGNQVLLLFFDLDHFKTVNDTLGHEVGDQLLMLATKRITERVRATDVLCRLGGDEFVMIMEGASPQDGHRLVRDIIAAFAMPFEIQQQKVQCTVSIGVSVYPDDTSDAQTLLVYADLAMYRAKQNGRNDFEFYTSNLNFIAHQWLEMEHGIRHALIASQLFIMYQPQLENTHNQLIGIEALIRWRHPERGLIPPLEFIKIAEQSSLINLIGEWVLEATCKQLRIWLDKKYKVPRVSMNISVRHLRSDSLIKTLSTIPVKYNIAPAMLCIEITEYALLEEVDAVKNNIRLIKDLGFNISLDDFGMGHSSLLSLKRWAVDEVKIDRSFVEDLVNREEDRVIVKAIIALGDALGLDLIAEGVENQEQADILIASGCKKVQGYFYSPPLEPKEMETWLKK